MTAKLFDTQGLARSPIDGSARVNGALTMIDCSPWPRAGVKGAAATDWLSARGALIPGINAAARQADGSLLARLAGNEYMSLAGAPDAAGLPGGLPDFDFDGDSEPGLCPVPRFAGNAWFMLSGRDLPAMFAKVCGVDLRSHKFGDLQVAQTIVARATAILIRDDRDKVLRFHLVADWTGAAYLWGALADAIAEFNSGGATG